MTERDIVVTTHAVDRARERWPLDCKHASHATICRRISREVAAAIAAGRMAVHLPRFAVRAGCKVRASASRAGRVRRPENRYVWTPDERRVYIIRRGTPTIVVTVIRPDSAEQAAA